MNEEIKAKWLERLRSGEIPQAQGHLGSPDGSRCCLGVLCDIAVEANIIYPPEINNSGEMSLAYMEEKSFLPDEVVDWAEIGSSDGVFELPKELCETIPFDSLVELNDGGYDFQKIAEIIEKFF